MRGERYAVNNLRVGAGKRPSFAIDAALDILPPPFIARRANDLNVVSFDT